MTDRQKRKVRKLVPSWKPCDDCGDYYCTIHKKHVYDCACPSIDAYSEVGVNPYLSWRCDDEETWGHE